MYQQPLGTKVSLFYMSNAMLYSQQHIKSNKTGKKAGKKAIIKVYRVYRQERRV